jgi:hypothetical protein
MPCFQPPNTCQDLNSTLIESLNTPMTTIRSLEMLLPHGISTGVRTPNHRWPPRQPCTNAVLLAILDEALQISDDDAIAKDTPKQ